jgi:hypothetical protein
MNPSALQLAAATCALCGDPFCRCGRPTCVARAVYRPSEPNRLLHVECLVFELAAERAIYRVPGGYIAEVPGQ